MGDYPLPALKSFLPGPDSRWRLCESVLELSRDRSVTPTVAPPRSTSPAALPYTRLIAAKITEKTLRTFYGLDSHHLAQHDFTGVVHRSNGRRAKPTCVTNPV